MIEDYKTTIQFEKEATLDTMDRANKVALAATTAYSFVENIGQVVIVAHLFEEGLQAAKDFATPQLRKFVRVITDYQDKMEFTLTKMRRINTLINGKVRTDRSKGKAKKIPELPPANQTPESQNPREQGAIAT